LAEGGGWWVGEEGVHTKPPTNLKLEEIPCKNQTNSEYSRNPLQKYFQFWFYKAISMPFHEEIFQQRNMQKNIL
jgi:hypothetical protein